MFETMKVDGVIIRSDFIASELEARAYIERAVEVLGKVPYCIVAKLSDEGFVDMEYQEEVVPFERVRRITGYLVGGTNRWNDAKTKELGKRVKHTLEEEGER